MCLCLIKPIVTFVFYVQFFILCTILYFVNLSVLVFLCSVCQTWFYKYSVIISQHAQEPFRHQLRGGASVHLYDCISPPLWPPKVHLFNLPGRDNIWSFHLLYICIVIIIIFHTYLYYIIILPLTVFCLHFWIFWLLYPFKTNDWTLGCGSLWWRVWSLRDRHLSGFGRIWDGNYAM